MVGELSLDGLVRPVPGMLPMVQVAGGHNILLLGVPETGKTMMAPRLPIILPDLSLEEALEKTRIYSTSGLLSEDIPLLVTRPYRRGHLISTPAV